MEEENDLTGQPESKKVAVIIAAGGSGSRFGQPGGKQYFSLAGKPIISYCLAIFQRSPLIDAIVIATASDRIKACKKLVKKYKIRKVTAIVKSGAERYDSVKNALAVLPQGTGYVLIHDGSRPLISEELVERVVAAAKKSGAAVPALPVVDTVKMVSKENLVTITLNRDLLRHVQTPQGFASEMIKQAYRLPGLNNPTDDASLVEETRSPVAVVEGLRENIKITFPEDIDIAGCLLKYRAKKSNRGKKRKKK